MTDTAEQRAKATAQRALNIKRAELRLVTTKTISALQDQIDVKQAELRKLQSQVQEVNQKQALELAKLDA